MFWPTRSLSHEQLREILRVAAFLGLLSLSKFLIDDSAPHLLVLGLLTLIGAAGILYVNIPRWIGPISKAVPFVQVICVGFLAASFIPRDPARFPSPSELPLTESIVLVVAVCMAAALLRMFGFRSLSRLDRWCLTSVGLLLLFPVGIFFGREYSIAGVVAATGVLSIMWLVDRVRRSGDERDASSLALPDSAEPRETWITALSEAAFGHVGVYTALIVGILAVVSALRPTVDEQDERILVASSRQIVARYNRSDFTGIAELLLDDLSLGEKRLELGQKRRIFADTLRLLNDASGPCDESLEGYGVSRDSLPKFYIRLDLACQERSLSILLVWGRRQNDPVLNLIGYQLPMEYYLDEIPGLRFVARRPIETSR